MQNRLVKAVLSALVLASGCASSAAEEAQPQDMDVDMDVDPAVEEDLDSGEPDGPTGTVRDAGPKDAGRPSGDGAVTEVGSVDAGKDGGMVVPGKDAAVDAGKPTPGVDAGEPLTCSGGTTACGNQCVATSTDEAHCGGCNKACSAGQTCTNSVCTMPVQVPEGCSAKTHAGRNYLFCTNTRSWPDARNACIEAGMDLSIVNDTAESDFVKANGDSWLGGNDRDREGAYRAVVPGDGSRSDGANLSFTRWAGGEPNNVERCGGVDIFVGCLGKRTDEDCIMSRADGQWVDELCDRSKRYVCEAY